MPDWMEAGQCRGTQNTGATFQGGASPAEAQLEAVAARVGVAGGRNMILRFRCGPSPERGGSDDVRSSRSGARLRQPGVPLAVPGYEQEPYPAVVRYEAVREPDEGAQV